MSIIHITSSSNSSKSSAGPSPEMKIQCGRQLHPNGVITIFAKLVLPDFPGLIEAIDRFIAIPSLIDITKQPAPPIQVYTQITIYTHVRQYKFMYWPIREYIYCIGKYHRVYYKYR